MTQEQLAEARSVAPVAAVQNRFGVLDQQDAAMVDECAAEGIAYMPFFALGGGHTPLAEDGLRKVADRHGATVHQIAIAWGLALLRHRPDPRHGLPRPPGGEHRRSQPPAHPGRHRQPRRITA